MFNERKKLYVKLKDSRRGFRDCVLARSVMPPAELERHNANLVGGDINGGAQDLRQLFLRPTTRLYSTPVGGLQFVNFQRTKMRLADSQTVDGQPADGQRANRQRADCQCA
jgi:hypothetical protein